MKTTTLHRNRVSRNRLSYRITGSSYSQRSKTCFNSRLAQKIATSAYHWQPFRRRAISNRIVTLLFLCCIHRTKQNTPSCSRFERTQPLRLVWQRLHEICFSSVPILRSIYISSNWTLLYPTRISANSRRYLADLLQTELPRDIRSRWKWNPSVTNIASL